VLKRPDEAGSIEDNRKFLIWLRDQALKNDHMQIAVALSHTIAWLYYLIQLEEMIESAKQQAKN
jgi:hypothetical protein